ncbi:sterol desaturase family protein [Halomonas sp. PR-M31]|uniref:sterol desaturase family protein n=1 Tax=Halomonas sp. PR-M31 TaxID=1471202 RepID=UPI000651ACC0|nr:sterol desaturase family protein [Halomonas sp. PR-M31]
MSMVTNALIILLTIVGMEVFAWFAHKYVMHGWGWGWHRSHHEPASVRQARGWFETNDLYAVVFAGVAIALIALGTWGWYPLQWIGAGVTAYGFLYFLAHDGLVHQRWPFRYVPRRGYLKRLYQAHRMHHAVNSKEGCVSFGFLIAPSVSTLKRQLREKHGGALQNSSSRDVARETRA